MTGQVKEEILTRLGEMGLFVKDGKITFHPVLLREEEFLKSPRCSAISMLPGSNSNSNCPPDLWPIPFVRRR